MNGSTRSTGRLDCQRSEFSLPEGLHYLNCAYMSPLPRRVEEAGISGMLGKRVPTTIRPADFFEHCDRCRDLFGRLIGDRDGSRVAIIPAVSYGVSLAARNTPLRPGQNIVVVAEQFPSHVYAWRRLAAASGGEMRTVAPPVSECRGEAWNAAILEAIDDATAVVALPQVHWTDGTRFELEAIGAAARRVGAAFVIDASQSVGAHPFDVRRIGPDAVICTAYKWLLGPYGIGVAWLGPRYDGAQPLEDTWIGRAGSQDFRALVNYREDYQPGAARFDVGERSNFILVPMVVAALELILEWGPERTQEYCGALISEPLEEARSLGFGVEQERWRGNHLFGLRAPAGLDLVELQELLVRRGVSVALRGSAMRVSPNVYNDAADIEALLDVLRASRVGATA